MESRGLGDVYKRQGVSLTLAGERFALYPAKTARAPAGGFAPPDPRRIFVQI
jgi:hypothetical protein